MKKRFTDTEKWADPWYRQLSPTAKLLWQWILDNCDNAGVINPDWDLATFQIGESVIPHIVEIESRIERIGEDHIFIPKFVAFQYPRLSRQCAAHKPVFASLEKYNLSHRLPDNLTEGYEKGNDNQSVTFPKVTGKGKGKGNGKGNGEGIGNGEGEEDRSGPMVPTLESVREFAREVPCSDDCAIAYHADRSSINWTKVKGGIQVEIEDWRNDLRGFALHWRNNEAERKRREANGAKPVTKAVDTKPKKTLEL
ncbi:MAG: hypothetical protein CL576_13630 [Alteromonas sp.]|nr:hypothetical protein [Alteromonas sp.]MBS09907.1 hypothetical protein [Alteromonas sp.]|tara:strand:+ start:5753 stop:6511 length:759 start_codon:yes stop_codon:yes gene_type:complete